MAKNTNHLAQSFKKIPNPSKYICNHLIGKEHRLIHRVIVGIMIMISGVYLTKLCLLSPYLLVHIVGDTVGFLIHGVGAIPVVEIFLDMNGDELDINQEKLDNNDNEDEYKQ